MKDEIHFINLFRTSQQLRELVSKLLGSSIKPWESVYSMDLLAQLHLRQTLVTLAARLECGEDQVFTKITARTSESIFSSYPLNFTIHDMRELDSMDTESRLAPILNCDHWDVLDELFDVHAMLNTLFEFAPEMVRQLLQSKIRKDQPLPSVVEVVRSIMLAHRRIEEHFGIKEHEWGKFIDERNWLRHSALNKLLRFCAERGNVQSSGASLLAVALQEPPQAHSDSSDKVQLDALAVIHIQQRINWIIQQLREQAKELAENIAARLASSPLARLKQHLEFYELKAPADAWRKIITKEAGLPPLQGKFPEIDIRSTGTAGTPLKGSVLRTRTEQIYEKLPFWRFRKKRKIIETNLLVSCETEEVEGPVDILICRNVSPAQIASLEEFFSAIPAIAASQNWVSDIGKKLLLVPRIFSQSLGDILVDASDRFSRELIQGLVLAGVKLKTGLEPTLPERLSSELWIKPTEVHKDVVHPLNRADIVELIRKHYVDQNNFLIIR